MAIRDGQVIVNASAFNKNLAPTDDTLPKVLQKFDQLPTGSAGGGTAATTTVVATSFTKNLSAADTDVQHALNTIDQLSFATGSGLPSQTGNAGKYLYTDGANASWQAVSSSAGSGSTGGAPEQLFYGTMGAGANASFTDYGNSVSPGNELFYSTFGEVGGAPGVEPVLNLGSGSTGYVDSLSTTEYKTNKYYTDGRPIYRKLLDFGALPNATTKAVAHGVTGVATWTGITGFASGSAGDAIALPYSTVSDADCVGLYVSTSNVTAITGVDRTYQHAYINLEYTKTTDSTGTIPSSVDTAQYSTAETAVGRWIDGKVVYRKVVDFGTLPNTTTKTVAHNIANFQHLVRFSGYTYEAGVTGWHPLPFMASNTYPQYNTQFYVNATNVVAVCSANGSGWTNSYVILEYTCTDR